MFDDMIVALSWIPFVVVMLAYIAAEVWLRHGRKAD